MKLLTNGTDFVIAESVEDARKYLIEYCGYSEEETDGEQDWYQIDNDKELKVSDELNSLSETKKVSEWIKENGRGLLASTEC